MPKAFRVALLAALVLQATPASARDNFLILVADDLGVDGVHVYSRDDLYGHPGEGAAPGPTPVLDGLAAEGVLFRNAYAYPTCSASRAAALTGRHAFRTHIGFVGGLLEFEETSLAELLAPTHANAAVGKWHLDDGGHFADGSWQLDVDHPIDSGFDYYAGYLGLPSISDYYSWGKATNSSTTIGSIQPGYSVYATTDIVDEAIAKIAEFGADPWLLWVGFDAPHEPYHVPPAHLNTIPVNAGSSDVIKAKAMTEAMDTEIGRLLSSLAPDVLEDTTVVFFGDNGSSGFVVEPPFLAGRAKATVYEGGINVPFLVKSPRIDPNDEGSESLALISVTDIFATLAEIAGLAASAEDSVSIVPYLEDPGLATQSVRPWVYSECFQPGGAGPYFDQRRAIRDDRYKVIWRDGVFEEFFDLLADPFEQSNLLTTGMTAGEATAYAALVSAMETLNPPACSNGLDDDRDGEVDYPQDPGRSDAEDLSERSSLLPCDDGIDNDSDIRSDFDPETFADPGSMFSLGSGRGDPGCKNPSWPTESPRCQNGIDDDPDGAVDFDAGASHGFIDPQGPDPHCLDKPWRRLERPECGIGPELVFLLPMLLRRRR